MQEGGSNPKPPQRFGKEEFLHWAARLKSQGAEVHALYEACGFGFLCSEVSALWGSRGLCHPLFGSGAERFLEPLLTRRFLP